MKHIAALAMFCLLLTGCASDGQAYAMAAPAISQPSETLTPSPVPSPTVDVMMTAQVLSNAAADKSAEADRQLARAKVIEAESMGTQIAAVATVQAANLAVAQLTATLVQQNKEIAVINMTIQAGNVKQAEANAKVIDAQTNQMLVKATWTAEAPARALLAEKAQIDAQNYERETSINQWGKLLVLLAIVMFLFVVIMMIIRGFQPDSGQPATEAEEPETPTISGITEYPGGLSLHVFNGVATGEQLQALARAVLSGTPMTHDNFTPAAKLFSEGKFQSVQYIFVKYGLAEWNDPTHQTGITPNAGGLKFLSDLIPDSPTEFTPPETPSEPVFYPIDTQKG